MAYEIEVRIRYSEIGEDHRLTIPSLINLLQDCSTFHTEDYGYGLTVTTEKNEGWFLFSWQIDIDRLPSMGEKVRLRTWASGYERLFVNRDYEMIDENGESIVRVRSIWALMNLQKSLPINPKEVRTIFPEETPVRGEWTGRKMEDSGEYEEAASFVVRIDQIDSNHHMNNEYYIEEAHRLVPEGRIVTGIRTEYRQQVMLSERVLLSSCVEKDQVTVKLCKEDGTVCALVRFLTRE